jgi:hypothetical protein
MGLSELHSTRSSFGHNCNSQEGRIITEDQAAARTGDAGLLEGDKYLAEVILEGFETTSGERQHYWLLAIKTAWKAKILWEQ